jgi:hypothetical protein
MVYSTQILYGCIYLISFLFYDGEKKEQREYTIFDSKWNTCEQYETMSLLDYLHKLPYFIFGQFELSTLNVRTLGRVLFGLCLIEQP